MNGAMLLYHGSNLAIEEPRLIGQVRGLDFGAGFYLTTSEPQAARFSEIVVRRRKTGAVKFITERWEGLHTAGPLYIIDSIDEYIKNHSPAAVQCSP